MCHSVDRILLADKTREEWEETVIRMRGHAPEVFLDKDLTSIIDYLSEKVAIMRDDTAAKIMVDKCLICHEAGKILLERKSRSDWIKTVTYMRNLVKERFKKDWFRNDELKVIVDLLVKTQGPMQDGN